MLAIRLHRAGRRNSSFFRIVLTEKSKPASGFKKILGWYNPHTKESSFKKEDILMYVQNGAQVSNSLAKILIDNKITHKNINFVPDAPGKPKKKSEGDDKAEVKQETKVKDEEKTEETEAEVAEDQKQDEQES